MEEQKVKSGSLEHPESADAKLAFKLEGYSFVDLARDAFIYGYPMVDMYNILYKYAVDKSSPEYKAPFNSIAHNRRLASPEDKAIIAPNCDTLYSYAWMDLRAEPIVLTIPRFEKDRYVSLQLNDLYTYIFGYVTPRTNGNEGGDFLIAGPDWSGSIPEGIKKIFQSATRMALAFYRTQLFGPGDITDVWAVQDGFKIQPLSNYLGMPAPVSAAPFEFIEPIDVRKEPTSMQFFSILNWMLQYMPALEEDMEIRKKLETMGVEPAPAYSLPDKEIPAALAKGMQAGLKAMVERLKTVRSSAELFGSREHFRGDFLRRAVGVMAGVLGNSAEEYMGIGYQGDFEGRPFDGKHAYMIKFRPGDLPPVKAFWSITVYDASSLLYANPLKRYVVNSSMIGQLSKDADGGFTLYIQHESPGPEREDNWLPVPKGKFGLTFRCYQPGEAILNFTYTAPPVVRRG
jgi:hypothetical protein